jgi:UDP-GlcNAc3NAcA epimerase
MSWHILLITTEKYLHKHYVIKEPRELPGRGSLKFTVHIFTFVSIRQNAGGKRYRCEGDAFPPELAADHISSMLFAPTPLCLDNLHREGLTKRVYLTGDVMLDCFLHFSKEAERRIRILDELDIKQGSYLLATVHRASNTDTKTNLQEICKAFIELAKDIELVFPVHPRTEKYLKQYDLYQTLADTPNIHLIKPVGYLEMLILTKNAKKILTDSGGLQKEAYFAKVPCITLDTVSAWPETVEDEWNVVGGKMTNRQLQRESIIHTARSFEPNKKQQNIFGDGKAAEKICDLLVC